MAKRTKPTPKKQSELMQQQITPILPTGKPIVPNTKKRENQRTVKGDDTKRFTIGLRDIDETIIYYFNNVIKPSVTQNGSKVNVPIIYGSQERWKSVQKDGFYRDKNGKIQAPLIMFKRDSVEKNRSLGNKVDPNNPVTFGIFKKQFSKKNVYDRFSLLTNREPVNEYYGVIVPEYVKLTYSCIIFTDYVEQMNKVIEGVNFASDSYWGDPEKFSFRASIDAYTTTTELTQGQDRAVKTTFTITMNGHIVPDSINASLAGMNKFYSKSSLSFGLEVAGNIEELNVRSRTPEAAADYRFFDQGASGVQNLGMSQEQIKYVSTNNTFIANFVTTNTALFNNKEIIEVPNGFTSGGERFTLYINGQFIPNAYYTVTQAGTDVSTVIQTGQTEYTLGEGDEVVLSGKIKE
jgi:hypothetical protein|tara:strand:- start:5089 stop:6306 length:1218 start_codon:yes stop_codon:yes gene_type:complete